MSLLSPLLRRMRLSLIEPYLRGAVLDLGCGDARLYGSCRPRISRYVGVERDPGRVVDLKRQYPEARFVARDIDRDRLELGETFDCVIMAALIEHVFNQEFVMRQVTEHLAPGGVILLTTPTVLGNDVVHRLGGRVGLFARGAVDDHIVIYNRLRFRTLAREVGLEVQRYRRFQLGCNQFVVLSRSP